MKVLVLCFVAALWLQLPSEGDAVCCIANGRLCNDCTKPTPYCGYQGCNVFGCNCGGGRCRDGQCRAKRSAGSEDEVRSEDAHDVIRAADQDADGMLSFAEARAHMDRHSSHSGHMERLLEAMDTDKDSFLTAREIDSDL